MTILLLGEINPYSSAEDDALLHHPEHASGNRLRLILQMTEEQYLAAFVRRNLLIGFGVKWSMPAAVKRARSLLVEHAPRLVVALGTKVTGAVCRACDCSVVDAFGTTPLVVSEALLLHLPHPSGLNRAWNVPGSRQRARDALADARRATGT